MDTNTTIDIAGITFKNPVIAASGTFGYGREHQGYMDLNRLGGISVKGVTLEPRKGNPPPRIVETPSGIINSVGLQNPGVEHFLDHELPWLKGYDTRIIVNIAGNTVEEYCLLAERLNGTGIDMLELNISCPNVKEGGIAFGTQPTMVEDITSAVKKRTQYPLVVKLSPNVGDIAAIARAAQAGGADGLSLINTITAMAVDIDKKSPVLKNVVGGLSGPAIKPIALRMVWQVCNSVDIPVIGMGGIMNGRDAVEFMMVGASAVAVGTANLVYPDACVRVLEGLEEYMASAGIRDIREIIGIIKI
ncbi:MAG: dihydroorotate dehydrogenase [Mahellales bacterium]|jgi:dihydroorotate dehydrogenase (NAD+) catalytic subunit